MKKLSVSIPFRVQAGDAALDRALSFHGGKIISGPAFDGDSALHVVEVPDDRESAFTGDLDGQAHVMSLT